MWDVMQPMLKLDMLCHYSIKIIFFEYSKPLSVEIVKNGWQPAECQLFNDCRDCKEVGGERV
jgi:hypothetical protein